MGFLDGKAIEGRCSAGESAAGCAGKPLRVKVDGGVVVAPCAPASDETAISGLSELSDLFHPPSINCHAYMSLTVFRA